MDQRHAFPGSADDIIPQIARIGGHCRDGGGGIQHGAPAQCNDKIALVFPGEGRAFHNDRFYRVFHDFVEYGGRHPGLSELIQRTVEGAVGTHGFPAGNQQQGFLAGHFLLPEFIQLSAAEKQFGWGGKGKAQHLVILLKRVFSYTVEKIVQTVNPPLGFMQAVQKNGAVAG